MQSLARELDAALRAGRSVCHALLVETRGSTPRKAGAAMLIEADGSTAGTLGGGAAEAEIKRRALELLPQGRSEFVTLQLDGDERWNDRLACGGQMKVLIATWRPEDDLSFPRMLIDTIATGRAATEVIVVAANVGNTNEGDRWLIDETGQVLAFHGARAASASSCPSMLAEHLKPLHQRPRPYLAGGMSFIPHLKRCRLIIVGAGHVGQRVAELAADVDFDVWVLDDRADFCNADRFPRASRRIVDAFDTSLPALPVDAETYCVIVTRGHQQDQLALKHLAETGARYVGMIGSRRKIRLILDNLLAEGISREALDRVHAPLGLDIGSQTVPEIAISIVAELISDRNLGPK